MDHFQNGSLFHIRVKGLLDHPLADWPPGIALFPGENDGTLLVGRFVDQSALRGFLDQLWNLNFTVISVEQVPNGISVSAGRRKKKGSQ